MISFSSSKACVCLCLQVSVFLSLLFIPCHSFVLSHHSQSSLLTLAELLYVNISASTSVSSGRGQSHIQVPCCLHLRILSLHFLPLPIVWLFFHTKKGSQLSLLENGERKQLPKIDPSFTFVCLYLLLPHYHYFSPSLPTLRPIFCLDTQSPIPNTPRVLSLINTRSHQCMEQIALANCFELCVDATGLLRRRGRKMEFSSRGGMMAEIAGSDSFYF